MPQLSKTWYYKHALPLLAERASGPVLLSYELVLVLRVLLNIMYLIVETVHQDCDGDKAEWRTMRHTFRAELGRPLGMLS